MKCTLHSGLEVLSVLSFASANRHCLRMLSVVVLNTSSKTKIEDDRFVDFAARELHRIRNR